MTAPTRAPARFYSPFVTAAYGQQPAERPVIDMTGLQGFFDFTLEWSPEATQADSAVTEPSLFTALEQQLGLKLQAQKSSAEFLVIDHAEKLRRIKPTDSGESAGEHQTRAHI